MPFRAYYKEINKNLRSGSTERSYYAGFQNLLQALSSKVDVFTEHGKIDVGHPDFEARLKQKAADFPIGWIEAKNPGEDLKKIERTDQLKRYLDLHSLILTDFIEFRWYRDGKQVLKARLGTIQRKRLKVDPKGEAAVRELLEQFLTTEFAPPSSPSELAMRMAGLAHVIREITLQTYEKEKKAGELHAQFQAFRETLIPDLEPDQFADMYAQTITYGLFAAACQPRFPLGSENGQRGQPRKATEKFTLEKAEWLIPKTNPFLQKLFGNIVGPNLDERVRHWVDILISLLAKADLGEILKDFGKRTGKEDPVVHFYEDFLQKYDPKVREMRGVYYTPEPVVQYIVRSIDHLLKTKFNKPDGLADKNVLILDPACGTGTFLYYVIRHIHSVIVHKKKQKGRWNTYVSQNLLKRVFGFELLMAPYAVAHLKLGLLLKELGYKFDTDERLGIFLTNTLEQAVKKSEAMFAQFIADEANAAADIKREKPIMVVLGNPPYSGHSANRSYVEREIEKGQIYHVKRGDVEVAKKATRKLKVKEKTFIGRLLDDYYKVDGKPLGEKNPKWLQDDYVKFLRFGQWRINQTGYGILGFITNHGYLDNPTFRGMRQQLLNEFTDIHILDLHGNTKKKERAPDGGKDENVFDIQQGVAIGLFIKEENQSRGQSPSSKPVGAELAPPVKRRGMEPPPYPNTIHPGGAGIPACGPAAGQAHHAELWGLRDVRKEKGPESLRTGGKYHFLEENDISTTKWKSLEPQSPFHLFVPRDSNLAAEYEKGWKITDIFPVNSVGIVTARDALTIRWSKKEVWKTVQDFVDLEPEEARNKYDLGKDARDWKVHMAQADLQESGPEKKNVVPILYRPFDVRYTYYTGNSRGFLCMPRPDVMRHMIAGKNMGFLATRQTRDQWDIHATSMIAGHKSMSAYDITSLLPLYKHAPDQLQQGEQGSLLASLSSANETNVNLTDDFLDGLKKCLGMEQSPKSLGDLKKTFGPEDVFHYIYAVLHSPTYRQRYAEFLKIDFPRVPLTSDKKLFRRLCELGGELVSLHLMESPKLSDYLTEWPESGGNEVEKPRFVDTTADPADKRGTSKNVRATKKKETAARRKALPYQSTGRVYINKTQYFEGVPKEVWEFHIGGYQVCEKWLKDRKGRKLSDDDLDHYQKIVVSLSETIRLMKEIDEAIPSWPIK